MASVRKDLLQFVNVSMDRSIILPYPPLASSSALSVMHDEVVYMRVYTIISTSISRRKVHKDPDPIMLCILALCTTGYWLSPVNIKYPPKMIDSIWKCIDDLREALHTHGYPWAGLVSTLINNRTSEGARMIMGLTLDAPSVMTSADPKDLTTRSAVIASCVGSSINISHAFVCSDSSFSPYACRTLLGVLHGVESTHLSYCDALLDGSDLCPVCGMIKVKALICRNGSILEDTPYKMCIHCGVHEYTHIVVDAGSCMISLEAECPANPLLHLDRYVPQPTFATDMYNSLLQTLGGVNGAHISTTAVTDDSLFEDRSIMRYLKVGEDAKSKVMYTSKEYICLMRCPVVYRSLGKVVSGTMIAWTIRPTLVYFSGRWRDTDMTDAQRKDLIDKKVNKSLCINRPLRISTSEGVASGNDSYLLMSPYQSEDLLVDVSYINAGGSAIAIRLPDGRYVAFNDDMCRYVCDVFDRSGTRARATKSSNHMTVKYEDTSSSVLLTSRGVIVYYGLPKRFAQCMSHFYRSLSRIMHTQDFMNIVCDSALPKLAMKCR